MENDLRRWMRLIENYGAGKLYHATTVENALRIIASGEIRATPTHVGHEQGVSLTQSFMFAQYWRDGVVFVFDRAKLHNRLMPIQWRPMHGEDDPGDEQEIFAYGSIPLDDALISITIGRSDKIEPSKWDSLEDIERKQTKLKPLVSHPKLNTWRPAPGDGYPPLPVPKRSAKTKRTARLPKHTSP